MIFYKKRTVAAVCRHLRRIAYTIYFLHLMANFNFMTIEVHSSEYIHLALCTHTLCRDNPAMLFPLLHFFLRMNFIQTLGGYHCKPSAMCMLG
jgi:hypothetical protein